MRGLCYNNFEKAVFSIYYVSCKMQVFLFSYLIYSNQMKLQTRMNLFISSRHFVGFFLSLVYSYNFLFFMTAKSSRN